MKNRASFAFCVWLVSSAWASAAVIHYDLDQASISGKDCPLQVSNLRISDDGREVSIDNSRWAVALTQASDGRLGDAVCMIRIPAMVPANYQVLQISQNLSYSYSKDAESSVGVYGNARLFDLADAPIDIQLGNGTEGTQFSVKKSSTANMSSWNKWCKYESQKGFLSINLGLSVVRSKRDRPVWVQLGQSSSPYTVRLDAVHCGSNVDSFGGSLGDKAEMCKQYNRDGLTCAGVGLHSPNSETCQWNSEWVCLDNGCAAYESSGDCP